MRMLSLCSGVGCIDLAAQLAGIEIAGQVEYDPFCQQVLAKHWPHVKRLSDIKDVVGDEFGPIDIVAGGIPCQPFSRAGQRRGTEDDRHLWPYAFSIIKKCQPTWVLIENVAGLIELALDLIASDLESESYEVQAYVLPAAAVGAPHLRQRCFIVAYSNSTRCKTPGTGKQAITSFQCSTNILDRQSQSRLGRGINRIANWLDRSEWRWPARPGEDQHAWEPPRTITGQIPNRGKRLKALGNAVVWQQISPFFQAMVEQTQP